MNAFKYFTKTDIMKYVKASGGLLSECSVRDLMLTKFDSAGIFPVHVLDEPQLKDLELVQVNKWYELGLQLGVEDTELEVIEKNNRGDLQACRKNMFRVWLRMTPTRSYQQLVEALVAMREETEADLFCKKYSK